MSSNFLFRIFAVSLVPITKDTHIYGSCDGGRTSQFSDSQMNEHCKTLFTSLGLAEHVVNGEFNYGPADIEGTSSSLFLRQPALHLSDHMTSCPISSGSAKKI